MPNQNDPVKLNQPPEDSGILQEDWSIFVKDRMSEEFKVSKLTASIIISFCCLDIIIH